MIDQSRSRPAFDPQPVLELIASIEADLARLKGMVKPPARSSTLPTRTTRPATAS